MRNLSDLTCSLLMYGDDHNPGQWQDAVRLDWLDRVLDLLHENEIRLGLRALMASPPSWMSRRHPDTLMATADGLRAAGHVSAEEAGAGSSTARFSGRPPTARGGTSSNCGATEAAPIAGAVAAGRDSRTLGVPDMGVP